MAKFTLCSHVTEEVKEEANQVNEWQLPEFTMSKQ